MKLDDGNWTVLGSAGFTNSDVSVISLVIDDEIPFVSYRDSDTDYKASVMKFNETNWEQVGTTGFSGGTHDAYQCLAVYGGTPYVASSDSDAKAAVYKFDGNNWVSLGSSDISQGQANYLSIDISDAGILYLAFSDVGNMRKLVVMKFVDGNWEKVGGNASLSEVSFASVAISNNGTPFVAYRDHWALRRTSVTKYSNATQITDLIDNIEFNIYPNPSNGMFTIESVDLKNQNFDIEIINQLGQVILSKQSYSNQKNQFDLSETENGIFKNNKHIKINDVM
ncbi:MAG: T9SS type A sorting domain-containing protein [Draconibacterium sp.]|nr:T9SS type A sorting domain-containing protein [Draconibacterium sp.]